MRVSIKRWGNQIIWRNRGVEMSPFGGIKVSGNRINGADMARYLMPDRL
jgi:hypothetical protein